MAAQTATNRMSKSQVQRLANLQKELAAAAPVDIQGNTTTTITIVYTSATKAITIDYAST